MRNWFNVFGTGFVIVAVSAIFLTVSMKPKGAIPSASPADRVSSSETHHAVATVSQAAMDVLRPSVRELADARDLLLKSAAQTPSDDDALHAASDEYREAVLNVRQKVRKLEMDLGPEQTKQMVGMMMMYEGMSGIHQMVFTEITGEVEVAPSTIAP